MRFVPRELSMTSLARRLRVLLLAVAMMVLGLAFTGAALTRAQGTAGADTGCDTTGGPANYTVTCSVGTDDTWTVPTGLTQATFAVEGAAGGSFPSASTGGSGGELSATLSVSAGSTYDIEVGATGGDATSSDAGTGGPPGGADGSGLGTPVTYGGGGGGASIVGLEGAVPADWLLVAGGGGGGGVTSGIETPDSGGNGGGTTGGNGSPAPDGGMGGTQTCDPAMQPDGTTSSGYGGGGGGGYCGGIGAENGGGGGGGSGYITSSAVTGSFLETTNPGNGSVVITYSAQTTHLTTYSTTALSRANFFDETVTFYGTLTEGGTTKVDGTRNPAVAPAGGTGIPGQTITFTLNRNLSCEGVTNRQGVATCQLSVPMAVLFFDAKYTASYAGNGVYLASSATGSDSFIPTI
jgi:hypothetical protein